MPFKTEPIKCKDHVRCEKLEAFPTIWIFKKNFVFNVHVKKRGGHIMYRLYEWEFAKELCVVLN